MASVDEDEGVAQMRNRKMARCWQGRRHGQRRGGERERGRGCGADKDEGTARMRMRKTVQHGEDDGADEDDGEVVRAAG